MTMEFRTQLVVWRRNKRSYVAYLGLLVALSSFLLVFVPSWNDYIPYVFGIGVAIVIIGAVIARGDVRQYGLSEEELVVSTDGITIGAVHYPLRLVKNMDFNVEAFAGRYVNDRAMISGSHSDGMTNDLKFESGGAKVTCGFFLRDKAHVYELGAVFEEFYRGHIPFIERNKSKRTYLFQFLSGAELEAFKRKYGYA